MAVRPCASRPFFHVQPMSPRPEGSSPFAALLASEASRPSYCSSDCTAGGMVAAAATIAATGRLVAAVAVFSSLPAPPALRPLCCRTVRQVRRVSAWRSGVAWWLSRTLLRPLLLLACRCMALFSMLVQA